MPSKSVVLTKIIRFTMSAILASLFHPSELVALARFKLSQPPLLQSPPSTPADHCYSLLNATSRSFSRVIQQLDDPLKHAVCIFYLVLRGLDTIEDDMTLEYSLKSEMLNSFHSLIQQPGWNWDGNGPDEKDRHLLVSFHHVITEFLGLKQEYRDVITDITKRMGAGMAEFMHPDRQVVTLEDYNLYTHYG